MEFHDVSTPKGKLKLFLSRINWLWIVASVATVAFITIWIITVERPTAIPDSPELEFQPKQILKLEGINSNPEEQQKSKSKPRPYPNSGKSKEKTVKKPGTYYFYGDGVNLFNLNLPGLNKSDILSLEIHNFKIDATIFTSSLIEAVNIESIKIVATELSGNFSRVHLPRIQQFSFSLDLDIGPEPFKDPVFLKSLLFFDKTTISKQDLDPKQFMLDVVNTEINIHVAVGHQTLIEIRKSEGLLNLNLPYCSEQLANLDQNSSNFTHLILSWCPLDFDLVFNSKSKTSLNLLQTIKYVNLNNAFPPTQLELNQLMKMLKEKTQLEEFHGFMAKLSGAKTFYVYPQDPNYQMQIDLNDLPSSLQKLSLSKIALTSTTTSTQSVSSLTELTLETCNVTNLLDKSDKINQFLPNLQSVSLFQLKTTPQEQQFKLLNTILQGQKVETILVTGLERNANLINEIDENPDSDAKIKNRDQVEIETKLARLNLEPSVENFIIRSRLRPTETNQSSDNDNGIDVDISHAQPLPDLEKHYRRFELMGFRDMDEFDYYVKHDTGEKKKSEGISHLLSGSNQATVRVITTAFVLSYLYF